MAIELTRLGVSIDPSEAEAGAKKAVDASRSMAREMGRNLDKVERDSKETGRTVDREGERMERSARDVNREFNRLGKGQGMRGLRRNLRANFGDARSLIVDFLGTLGLLDSGIGRLIQRGDNLANVATRAGQSFGSMGAGAAGARAGVAGLMASMGPLLPIIAAVVAALAALAAGIFAVKAAFDFIAGGFPIAAQIEDATVSLAVLLGDFDLAKQRIEEVNAFAAATPFETPELIETSRILQIFTDGALATTEGLTLIGDAAAGVGRPINEVAQWIGRLYAALQGGQPVGEATMRLLEMGAIAPDVKAQLDDLAASGNVGGENFAEIWSLAEASLQRFSGTMELRSRTWNGLLSTVSDNWNLLRAGIAAPIQDALKPILIELAAFLESMIPLAKSVGETIGTGIKAIIGIVKNGDIGRLLAEQMIAAFGAAFLYFARAFAELIRRATVDMEQIVVPMVNKLLEGIEMFIDRLISGAEEFGRIIAGINPFEGTAATRGAQGLMERAGFFGPQATPDDVVLGAPGLGPRTGIRAPDLGRLSATGGSELALGVENYLKDLDPLTRFNDVLEDGLRTFESTYGGDPQISGAGVQGDAGATGALQAKVLKDAERAIELSREKLQLAREEGEILQARLDGDLDRVRALENEAEIRREITEEMRKFAPALSEQLEQQLRMNQAMRDQMGPVQELANRWLDLGTNAKEAITGIVQNMETGLSSAMTDAVLNTTSWRDAFEQMGEAALRNLIQIINQMWIQYTVALLLKSVTGGIFGGAGGGLFGGGGGAAVAHTGGGLEGAGIRRFHTGGRASSERLAMLEEGETVLTREQSSAIRDRLRRGRQRDETGGSGQPQREIKIMNVMDPNQVNEAIAGDPDIILNAINSRLPAVRRMLNGA